MLAGRAGALVLAAGMALGDSGHAHPARLIARAQAAVLQALTQPSLSDVATTLAEYHAVAGTYVDAGVGGSGQNLQLAWATDTAYCIESVGPGGARHLVGPGGSEASGLCP